MADTPAEVAEALASRGSEGQGLLWNYDDPLRLSSGIVLSFGPVSLSALRRLAALHPEPPVPTQFIESKGRNEPNPAHPDYIAALRTRDETLMMAAIDLCFIQAVKIDHVPDELHQLEADDWIDELEVAGIDVPRDTPARRRLSYLKLYALRTSEDLSRCAAYAVAHAGILESEVSTALRSFLGVSTWGADRRVADQRVGLDGNPFSRGAA